MATGRRTEQVLEDAIPTVEVKGNGPIDQADASHAIGLGLDHTAA
ncbi:hypothetical protein ACWEN3_04740 [Streptomyces sp. NPDC004561]